MNLQSFKKVKLKNFNNNKIKKFYKNKFKNLKHMVAKIILIKMYVVFVWKNNQK